MDFAIAAATLLLLVQAGPEKPQQGAEGLAPVSEAPQEAAMPATGAGSDAVAQGLQDAGADAQLDTQDEADAEAEAEAEAEQADVLVEAPKPKKITDRSHPDYVRCKSEAVLGSRARRKRTCMTNKEWALVTRRGNEASRDFVGDNQPGFMDRSQGF